MTRNTKNIAPEALQKKRVKKILTVLCREYPEAKTALVHVNPFQLLIATILSAQCTDKRVNLVTKNLFKKYKNPGDFARAEKMDLERDIHSTGFFRNKAKNIINCCKILEEQFNGTVPDKMNLLLGLPGVGRKTANVVLGNAFNKKSGIVVDTHVKRLSNRIGLTRQKDPEKIEKDLVKIVPKKDWIAFPHLFIFHGRNTCTARKPDCSSCKIFTSCDFVDE